MTISFIVSKIIKILFAYLKNVFVYLSFQTLVTTLNIYQKSEADKYKNTNKTL